MNSSNTLHSLAQNRIDYIVYHNPDAVSELLEGYGFEAPEDPLHLAEAVKELTRKKGRKIIKALIGLHPDTSVILKLNAAKSTQFCGVCNTDSYNAEGNVCTSCGHSNYAGSGDEAQFLSQFKHYSDRDLERYYQTIVKRSNADLQDKPLAQEVQMIWNELRTRKTAKKSKGALAVESQQQQQQQFSLTRDDLMLFGVVFIAGALVGHSLKFNSIHVT